MLAPETHSCLGCLHVEWVAQLPHGDSSFRNDASGGAPVQFIRDTQEAKRRGSYLAIWPEHLTASDSCSRMALHELYQRIECVFPF